LLDPADWERLRALGHQAVDDAIAFWHDLREAPTWRPLPPAVRKRLRHSLEAPNADAAAIYDEYRRDIQPYHSGNVSPRFFGWVQGSGTPAGALAAFLAAVMNPNVGGRDHAAVEVERAVIRWSARAFGFPDDAGGLLVSGTSVANLIAVLVARQRTLGPDVRERGVDQTQSPIVGYASAATHSCVTRAFEVAGLGRAALRLIPADGADRIDLAALQAAIAADRAAGARPFLLVGNAGTVNTGAIDPLPALADVAEREGLWFHVDGAFGALVALVPELRGLVAGLERADSLAFDFHKWLHVPYDSGAILIRDAALQRATFASEEAYLKRRERGLAAGLPWLTDFGLELSRGFRALPVWFTLREFGAERIGAAIAENIAQAQRLAARIAADPEFELAAPVSLNIVCFRYRLPGADSARSDAFTDDLAVALQESGAGVVSATTVRGGRALRLCIVNQRATDVDLISVLEALRTLARDALR
jgi:glutamate/tyrosine decarboxylase-like PLP-dependent enzyme